MIKKYLIFTLLTLLLNASAHSAGKTDKEDKSYMIADNSNYTKGLNALKQAKRYDKKKKLDKAKKRFDDAAKFFTLANEENPSEPDILNYLGFSLRKAGDFTMAEIYYEQGLALDPQHIGINEYLGELYVETNRIEKAKERLKVLENCKCNEFEELKTVIKQRSSKY